MNLTRDYYAQFIHSKNEDIRKLAHILPLNINRSLERGLVSPQTFTHVDKIGIIQDNNNILTIYHRARHKTDKSIPIFDWNNRPLKFS